MTRSGKEQSLPGITVYTKPGCVQCRATVRALQRAGLDHVAIDISTDRRLQIPKAPDEVACLRVAA
jgi:hypothetical protein